MSARLTDDKGGLNFEVRPGVNTIGRREENDICLPAPSISRFHCEVRFEGGEWAVEDQGSSFGTYVNGQKVEGAVTLADGDCIILGVTKHAPDGEFRLTFHAPKGAGAGAGAGASAAQSRAGKSRKRIEAGRWALDEVGECLVVRMAGVFRRNETDELARQIKDELDTGMRPVVLALAKVTYMNSYTLSALIELGASLREKGGSLRVFGQAGSVKQLLMIAGDASPIDLCNSESAAMR